MNRSEHWSRACAGAIACGSSARGAAQIADEALVEFDNRFRTAPVDQDEVKAALDSYLRDPADSEHQRGYLSALLDLYKGSHPMEAVLREQLHA